jgi:hypothetical protein
MSRDGYREFCKEPDQKLYGFRRRKMVGDEGEIELCAKNPCEGAVLAYLNGVRAAAARAGRRQSR